MMKMHLEDSEINESILKPTWIDELHKHFIAFYENIDKTKSKILDLKDNWDEEGAKSYKKETWERATEFTKKFCFILWRQTQKLINPPNILPGPDGSIDIHWKTAKFDLLINIAEDPNEPATFSSDDYGQNAIKGTFDPKKMSQALLSWLLEFI
jgi:hypothetical protein